MHSREPPRAGIWRDGGEPRRRGSQPCVAAAWRLAFCAGALCLLGAVPSAAQDDAGLTSADSATVTTWSPAADGLRPGEYGTDLEPWRRTTADTADPGQGGAGRRAPSSLLRAADARYAGMFLVALHLSRAAPGLDREVSRTAFHGDGGPDLWLHEGGAVVGNGLVDLAVTGAAWAGGELAGAEGVSRVALRSLESVVASDVMAFALKLGIGRQRPAVASDPAVYRPGTLDREYYSFPSGHTAHAFALAATLSRELEAGWVPYVAYPLAGAVGVGRVVGRRHWPTDVVAGAAVGLFSSHLVDRLHGGDGLDAGPRISAFVGPSHLAFGVRLPVR